MSRRGRRSQIASQNNVESLEDLLKALEPDSEPAPPAPSQLNTSELEDLIAGLDDVVEEKPKKKDEQSDDLEVNT